MVTKRSFGGKESYPEHHKFRIVGSARCVCAAAPGFTGIHWDQPGINPGSTRDSGQNQEKALPRWVWAWIEAIPWDQPQVLGQDREKALPARDPLGSTQDSPEIWDRTGKRPCPPRILPGSTGINLGSTQD